MSVNATKPIVNTLSIKTIVCRTSYQRVLTILECIAYNFRFKGSKDAVLHTPAYDVPAMDAVAYIDAAATINPDAPKSHSGRFTGPDRK